MARLNYHHLLCFSTVAREGTVVSACRTLNLTQPTLSAQIKALEESLDQKLFLRSGRRLVLTDVGKVVLRYARRSSQLAASSRTPWRAFRRAGHGGLP